MNILYIEEMMKLMKVDRSKSNLKIKVRTKKKVQQIEQNKSRKSQEIQLLTNANLIFALDNGTTRNN